jgi:hypothetical protein
MPDSKSNRFALPPSSAEMIGLASTTSFSGLLEIGKDGILGKPTVLHGRSDLISQRGEKVFLDFEWQALADSGQEEPNNFPTPRDNDRLFLFEEAGCAIAKLSDSRSFHVVIRVDTL